MKKITEIIDLTNSGDELTGAISTPIYQTTTYIQEYDKLGEKYCYSRTGNPTRNKLETVITKLENGHSSFAFASGLSAIDAIFKLLKQGDEVISVNDVYGGTIRTLDHIYSKFGISTKYIDTTDISNLENAISDKTKLIWIESPTNPTLKISDIVSIAQLAKKNNSLFAVDNTFASPYLMNPIDLGADIVMHSATKYLSGHDDVSAGTVTVNSQKLADEIKYIQNTNGAILSPFDSWLLLRGIQTLELRMQKQCDNAMKIALELEKLDAIDKIYYPGLKSHKNHDIAKQQMRDFGAMISFSLKKDSFDSAKNVINSLKIFKLAESLGGLKSLITHPPTMTHASVDRDVRLSSGIQDSLLRLTIGIEDVNDLINDLIKAIK